MEIKVKRYNHDRESTQGLMFIDDIFACHTLEDEERLIKVKGETRIPAGRYEIKLRQVLSPLTQIYRDRFQFFTWHMELQNVPNFKHVYIHIGNTPEDTDACLLVADTAEADPLDRLSKIWKSTPAFKRIYQQIVPVLESGERVFIDIDNLNP